MSADIQALTGEETVRLSTREMVFYNVDVASRQSEQERITALWAMSQGKAPLVITTVDGLMQRTLSVEQLQQSSMTIQDGKAYDVQQIIDTLTLGGYTRCQQVEGAGQFSVRGGILDFYSPAYPEPVRVEFFGDDVDSMSFFDVSTQRRTEKITSAQILPAAETLPTMCRGGREGLAQELNKLYKRLAKRKNISQELMKNVAQDAQRLEEGRTFPAADRYMDIIYSSVSTALDYAQPDALLFMCEPGRLREQARSFADRTNEDIKVLIEGGVLESGLCRYYVSWEDLRRQLWVRQQVVLSLNMQFPCRSLCWIWQRRILLSIQ